MSVTAKHINDAVDTLKRGGVVLMPTETSYGLAADAANTRAVKRALAVKGRGHHRTPALIAASKKQAGAYVRLHGALFDISSRLWPGPLTIIAPYRRGSGLSTLVRNEDEEVGIRVSSHFVARALARKLGKPIIATSANRAGKPDCYSVRAWRKQYAGQALMPDMILDAGALPRRRPSTIVKEGDEGIEILRQGSTRIPERYA